MKRGNYIRTPKIRKKASNATKKHLETHPHPCGMLGKHHSEEAKQKIGAAQKGKKHSLETIQKMKDHHVGMTGKHHSEKTKREMGRTRKGRKLPPLSEEAKQKIGLANKGRKHSEETKRKISAATKGKPKSEQMKLRLGESRKGAKHPLWKGGKYKEAF